MQAPSRRAASRTSAGANPRRGIPLSIFIHTRKICGPRQSSSSAICRSFAQRARDRGARPPQLPSIAHALEQDDPAAQPASRSATASSTLATANASARRQRLGNVTMAVAVGIRLDDRDHAAAGANSRTRERLCRSAAVSMTARSAALRTRPRRRLRDEFLNCVNSPRT